MLSGASLEPMRRRLVKAWAPYILCALQGTTLIVARDRPCAILLFYNSLSHHTVSRHRGYAQMSEHQHPHAP
jgi:hypothetical protein